MRKRCIVNGDIPGRSFWGEPGIGKRTSWPGCAVGPTGSSVLAAISLYNIQPDPESLPRYVLKCVIHRLIFLGGSAVFTAPPSTG